jgi:hypothetical protein
MAVKFSLNMPDFHVASRDLLHAVKLRQLYFPSKGRCAEDFSALKNPTASAGFEPVNLGSKGQRANSRPPKLQYFSYLCSYMKQYGVCPLPLFLSDVHTEEGI